MEKEMRDFERNAFDMPIRKCCASCKYKGLTRAVLLRRCQMHDRDVSPMGVCCLWEMNQTMRRVGMNLGRVKRHEYLMYVLAVREQEDLEELAGQPVKPKSLLQLRQEFERKHGSIYAYLLLFE